MIRLFFKSSSHSFNPGISGEYFYPGKYFIKDDKKVDVDIEVTFYGDNGGSKCAKSTYYSCPGGQKIISFDGYNYKCVDYFQNGDIVSVYSDCRRKRILYFFPYKSSFVKDKVFKYLNDCIQAFKILDRPIYLQGKFVFYDGSSSVRIWFGISVKYPNGDKCSDCGCSCNFSKEFKNIKELLG